MGGPINPGVSVEALPTEYSPRRIVVMALDGTDAVNNDSLIAAALARVVSLSPSAAYRVALIIRPVNGTGLMRFETPFAVPKFVDVFQSRGSVLNYYGSTYTTALLTLGETATTTADYALFCRALNVVCKTHATHKFWRTEDGGTVNDKRFAAIRIGNTKHADIEVAGANGCSIGIQLFPYPGSFCAHNTIRLAGTINVFKYAFDFRGNTSSGYCNENIIRGPGDITPSSSMAQYGSAFGVRFSAEPGGYVSNNNNSFDNVCWQLIGNAGEHNTWAATTAVTAGTTKTFGGREYIVTVGGTTGGSGPTHITGDAADGSATLRYLGPFRRAPMYFDESGQNNHLRGGRYETGYGPPIIIRRGAQNSAGLASSAEFGMIVANVAAANNAHGFQTDMEIIDKTITSSAIATTFVKSTALGLGSKTITLGRLHFRAIVGASGAYVPGMPIGRAYSSHGGMVASRTSDIRHTVNGLYFTAGSDGPLVLCPVSTDFYTYEFAWSAPASPDGPRFVLMAFDSDLAHIASATDDYPIIGTNGYLSSSTLYASTDAYGFVGAMANKANVAYIGFALRQGIVSDLSIKQIQKTMQTAPGSPASLALIDERFGSMSGRRFTNGAVTSGIFPTLGERIDDLGSTTTYRVTTVGIIAPAWVTATPVVSGEYRSNASKIYFAAAAGTTGATAPTHGSGSVSDGTVTWTYVGPPAVLA